MEDEYLKDLAEMTDDDLLDRLMNFGIHEAIFSCENEECDERKDCKIAKNEETPSVEYTDKEDGPETTCPRSQALSEKLDAIIYQVRLRLFIARICYGQLSAIRSETGEFNSINKNGMISYKQQLLNIKESVETITDLINDLADYEISLDDVEELVDIKRIDPDGNSQKDK